MALWKRFEDMDLWKKGCRLTCDVYRATSAGELKDDFALRDQLRKSALSVPSNVAEGFEIDSPKGFVRHLRIAKGSAGELRTQLYIAGELGFISRQQMRELVARSKVVSRMAGGLITRLRPAKKA